MLFLLVHRNLYFSMLSVVSASSVARLRAMPLQIWFPKLTMLLREPPFRLAVICCQKVQKKRFRAFLSLVLSILLQAKPLRASNGKKSSTPLCLVRSRQVSLKEYLLLPELRLRAIKQRICMVQMRRHLLTRLFRLIPTMPLPKERKHSLTGARSYRDISSTALRRKPRTPCTETTFPR